MHTFALAMAAPPSSIEDLVNMCKTKKDRLKSVSKSTIEEILEKDDTRTTTSEANLREMMGKILEEMGEIRKTNERMLNVLGRIETMEEEMKVLKKENSALKEQLTKHFEVVEKQQSFLERIDSKERSTNLIVLGVPEGDFLETQSDVDKIQKVINLVDRDSVGATRITSLKRLGQQSGGKTRPILVSLPTMEDRNRLVGAARETEHESLVGIKLKKDTHPSVRAEWKRLFDAKRNEEEKAENAGKTIEMDMKKRQLICDGQVVDSWSNKNFF